jgi:phosphoribosylaminoimidazole (AIR) synthetase
MGMGMAVVVAQKDVEKSVALLKKYSDASVEVIGSVEKGSGVEVPSLGLTY